MTVTLEDRVEVLEGKVENLETLREFGRELTGKLAEFDKAQQKQSQTLDIHTGKLNGLEKATRSLDLGINVTRNEVKECREEVSGKLERLNNDATWLKGMVGGHDMLLQALSTDVANLGDNITGLKADVAGLQADVTGLKADVAGLQADVTGLKADVTGLKADVAGLQADVTGLKADVTGLKADVTGLKADVAGLQADVTGLKADVAGLKGELAEFKVEVRGTLAEILDRLPPKAA